MTFEHEEVIKFLEVQDRKWARFEKRHRQIKIMTKIGLVFYGVFFTLILVDVITKVG